MGTIVKRGKGFRAMVRRAGHAAQYKTFPTQRQAERWVREVESDLADRDPASPDVPLSLLIDRYVAEVVPRRRMAASHLAHDVPSVRRAFDGLRLSDLSGRGLVEWATAQPASRAASTCNWHVARLFGLLRQFELHWGTQVPWTDLRRCHRQLTTAGTLQLPGSRDRRVSDDELQAIKQHLRGELSMARIIDFCVATCMRIGEVVRIRWDDLSVPARTVVIRDRKHPTKKFGNHQTVPLLGRSLDLVLAQPRAGERIFPHSTTHISRLFHQAAVRAGVEGVVLHDLRHEGISRLFELGFAIQEVALISGHTNWRTLSRYTHLRPGDLIAREAVLLKSRSPAFDRASLIP